MVRESKGLRALEVDGFACETDAKIDEILAAAKSDCQADGQFGSAESLGGDG